MAANAILLVFFLSVWPFAQKSLSASEFGVSSLERGEEAPA